MEFGVDLDPTVVDLGREMTHGVSMRILVLFLNRGKAIFLVFLIFQFIVILEQLKGGFPLEIQILIEYKIQIDQA